MTRVRKRADFFPDGALVIEDSGNNDPGAYTWSLTNVTGPAAASTTSSMSGRYPIEWDGRDDQARPVARGVYFARLFANGVSETRKVARVR